MQGDLAANLANVDSTGQHWFIDPLYYQYSGCNCLGVSWLQGMSGGVAADI